MATEDEKPTTTETGETPPPVTTPEASKEADAPAAPSEAAGAPKTPAKTKQSAKPKTATATKGTTGASTTTADGTPATKAIQSLATAAQQVMGDAAAGFTTVTGSDEDTKKVYQGEPPMSPEDREKASRGFDPLTVRVPDGQAYGNMGLPHVAKKSDAPIGPTGNVPTGAPHADLASAAKLDEPLAKERKKALEE